MLAGWEGSSPPEGLVQLPQLQFLDNTPTVNRIHTKFCEEIHPHLRFYTRYQILQVLLCFAAPASSAGAETGECLPTLTGARMPQHILPGARVLREFVGSQAHEAADAQKRLYCLLRSLLGDSPGIKFPWKTQYLENNHSRGSYARVV